jgi:hypothetical protein
MRIFRRPVALTKAICERKDDPMKIKTTLIALVLAAAPGLALAGGGCNSEKTNISASSCVEGTVYDAATGTCVPQTTS